MTFPFTDLIDTLALALVHEPVAVTEVRSDDARIAVGTAASRAALGDRHTKLSGRAMARILDARAASDRRALTGRQLHVLVAIAAADLLERDQLAAFLDDYVDSGAPVWYQGVSVAALRNALHEVLEGYEPAKRARLLTSLAQLTQDELLRWAPLGTPFAPAFLDRYATSRDRQIRNAVGRNPNAAPNTLTALSKDDDETVRAGVAANPSTSADDLDRLATDDYWEARIAVAANGSARADTLARLAEHRLPSVRMRVGGNPNTHPDVLDTLAHDRDGAVRGAVAANPHAEARTLHALTTYQPVQVRIAIGAHPNADDDVLGTLLTDSDARVRAAVGANTNSGTGLLDRLADDKEFEVRVAVATNPSTHPNTLAKLAKERSWNIRLLIAEHPHALVDTLTQLASDQSANVRAAVAAHSSATTGALTVLVADANRDVREAVASNANTSADVLALLVGDAGIEVRVAVAQHPNTTTALLAQLATDDEHAVREAVAEHPNTTTEVQALLAQPRTARRGRVSSATARTPRARPNLRTATPRLAGSSTRRRPSQVARAAEEHDPHARYAIAVQRGAIPRRAIPAPEITRLAAAVTAVRAGGRPASSDVRNAATLPNLDDVPFPTAAAAQAQFADAPVVVSVLANGREQRRNGILMNNCTLTDSYIAACEAGTTVVAAFVVKGEAYNIAWSYEGQHWKRRDLKGLHNRVPPPAVERLGDELTTYLTGLLPLRPRGISSADALAEFTVEASHVLLGPIRS